jgi:hypothetical protein
VPHFTFSQVEAILAQAFNVTDEKRGTFVARLQQLQKFGIPGQTNVGRGRKATYDAAQIMKVHLALDLLDVGLGPALIKTIIEKAYNDERIRLECGAIQRLSAHPEGPTTLVIVPAALTYLRLKESTFDDHEAPLCAIFTTEEEANPSGAARIILDLSQRVYRLIDIVTTLDPALTGQPLFEGN